MLNTEIISEILLNSKNFWSSYVKKLYESGFWDSDLRCFRCQVAVVVVETAQLVLSQF